MAAGVHGSMTLARVRTFLQLSGADREASDIVNAAGITIDGDEQGVQDLSSSGYTRYEHIL